MSQTLIFHNKNAEKLMKEYRFRKKNQGLLKIKGYGILLRKIRNVSVIFSKFKVVEK